MEPCDDGYVAIDAQLETPEQQLLRIVLVADALPDPTLAREARAQLGRVKEGKFYVACLGQFKRGKSTVLNALLGSSVLPTGVTPVTNVPIVVTFCEKRSAIVRFRSGVYEAIPLSNIGNFVSEASNPRNGRAVELVEAFVNADLLSEGMCLVDTPGLGSVFDENGLSTHAFVPHIDAAIIVLGSDPPIAGEELNLAKVISAQVPEIIVVINKVDRSSSFERSEAVAFTREILSAHDVGVGALYEVSALAASTGNADEHWRAFESRIRKLTSDHGTALRQSGARRGAQRLNAQCLNSLSARRRAILSPEIEVSEKLASLLQAVNDAQEEAQRLGYQLAARIQIVVDDLRTERLRFLASTRPDASRTVLERLAGMGNMPRNRLRVSAMEVVQEVARQHVAEWLENETTRAQRLYETVADSAADSADRLLAALAGRTEGAVTIPLVLSAVAGMREREPFLFHTFERLAAPASPLRWLADSFRTTSSLRWSATRDALSYLDYLLTANTARVQNDLAQRVLESRTALERDIKTVLMNAATDARCLHRATLDLQRAGSAAVHAELERLGRLEIELCDASPLP